MIEEEVRRMMRRDGRSEPGEEPGTLVEDISSATAVMEEPQHPDDWDPETHGDIPLGKGEPPAAYFQRMRKGANKVRGLERRIEMEEGKGKKKGSSPQRGAPEPAPPAGAGGTGRVAGAGGAPGSAGAGGEPGSAGAGGAQGSARAEGASGFAGARGSSYRGEAVGAAGSSQGGDLGNGQREQTVRSSGGGKGVNDRGPVYITQWGQKYHTHEGCSTLKKTRNLRMSSWCEVCTPVMAGPPEWIYSHGPGQTAHVGFQCASAGGARRYDRCNMCGR